MGAEGSASGPLLLVLGDSLAYHGPQRLEPADEPRLWPNVAAAALGGRAELVARSGWTARHAWAALADDPRIWALLPRIDALVLGTGGMDSLPSPLPTSVRELLPALRPEPLRRAVRYGYLRAQPRLSRAFAAALPGGGPATLPARLTVAYLERCRAAVHALRPGLPVLTLLPSVHRAGAYGGAHPHRAAAERATREWATAHGVGLLDVAAAVSEHVLGGHGNVDGMHWGWDGHRRVGEALGAALAPMLAASR